MFRKKCHVIFFCGIILLTCLFTRLFQRTIKHSDGNFHLKHHEFSRVSKQIKETSTCIPRFPWIFIKTHKTGGSNVKYVLEKFAKTYGKPTIDEFPAPALVGGYPGHIKTEYLFSRNNGNLRKINLTEGPPFSIAGHFRFNYTALEQWMPRKTKYLSIIREPWKNFQSSFYFYYNPIGRPKSFNKATCPSYPYFHVAKGRRISFVEYLQVVFDSLHHDIPWFFRSRNYQAHDLGLDPLLEDEVEINRGVKTLGDQIDLMMITDYMDESMILLKELLCMTWTDIVYYDFHTSNEYTPVYYDQDTAVMKKFNKFYKLDIALYNFFNQTFWKKIDLYGRLRMEEDVQKLRLLRKKIKKLKSAAKAHPMKIVELFSEQQMQEAFRKSLFNLNHEDMIRILKQKINPVWVNIGTGIAKLKNSLAEYTVKNNGGCPVELNELS